MRNVLQDKGGELCVSNVYQCLCKQIGYQLHACQDSNFDHLFRGTFYLNIYVIHFN